MGEEEDMDARRRSPPATCSSSETLPAVVCHVTCRIACWAALPDQIDLTRIVASQPEPGSGSLPGHGQREESLGLGPVSVGGPLDHHRQLGSNSSFHFSSSSHSLLDRSAGLASSPPSRSSSPRSYLRGRS